MSSQRCLYLEQFSNAHWELLLCVELETDCRLWWMYFLGAAVGRKSLDHDSNHLVEPFAQDHKKASRKGIPVREFWGRSERRNLKKIGETAVKSKIGTEVVLLVWGYNAAKGRAQSRPSASRPAPPFRTHPQCVPREKWKGGQKLSNENMVQAKATTLKWASKIGFGHFPWCSNLLATPKTQKYMFL